MPHNDGEPAETRRGRIRERVHEFRENREEKQRQRKQKKAKKQQRKRDRRRAARQTGNDLKEGVKATRIGSIAGTLVSGVRSAAESAQSAAGRASELADGLEDRGYEDAERVAVSRGDVDGDGEPEDVLTRLDDVAGGGNTFLDADGDGDADVVLSGFGEDRVDDERGMGTDPFPSMGGGGSADPFDGDPLADTPLGESEGGGDPFLDDSDLDDIFGGL